LRIEREHPLIKDFPFPISGRVRINRRGCAQRKPSNTKACPQSFRPEYIIAIAASVGRTDLARIEQLLKHAKIDKTRLDDILRRYKLKLPKPEIRCGQTRATAIPRKIRRVGELIQLSRKIKAQRDREDARNYPQSGFRTPQSPELLSKNSKK